MYNTVGRLGHGGFGVVELIEYPDGTQCAKKTFHPMDSNLDQDLLDNVKKRFKREVGIQSQIVHPNIMPILEADIESDPPSYIMPLATTSLDKQIKSITDKTEILKILLDILAGLEELHSLDIQHRDLKPQNILLIGDKYVISDFGLVSMKDTQISALTQTGMRMGSDFYTAPEIVEELKNASSRSDIYSFGCILHDFFGTKNRVPCHVIYDTGGIAGDIIEICTRQDPNSRFQNVKDLREVLVESLSNIDSNATISRESIDYRSYLKNEDVYDDNTLTGLFNYLERSNDTQDVYYIFNSVTNEIVEKILKNPERAKDFANLYSNWVRKVSHVFSRCDVIAVHLDILYENVSDLGARANILLALLIMGASHNRWYVEQKFISLAQNASNNLCRRFVMEARVIGDDVRYRFNHLEQSIGSHLEDLPETMQQYFSGDA